MVTQATLIAITEMTVAVSLLPYSVKQIYLPSQAIKSGDIDSRRLPLCEINHTCLIQEGWVPTQAVD